MKRSWAVLLFALLIISALAFAPAQTPKPIPLSKEPHHRLAFHNAFVNVYRVEVAPHQSVLLHHHDHDAIGIMLADSEVTVHSPGKLDVHQNLKAGQVRLQQTGYTHATEIDSDTPYRNITVELLQPQHNPRNLCAQVMAGQHLTCLGSPTPKTDSNNLVDQPQFDTDETMVVLTRVLPHQKAAIKNAGLGLLIIALDDLSVSPPDGSHPRSLRPGDFLWIAPNDPMRILKNNGNRDARFVSLSMKPKKKSKQA